MNDQTLRLVREIDDLTGKQRILTCRYSGRHGDLCTGEAVDPDGEILLCIVHLGRALELLAHRHPPVRKLLADTE